jgi:hypothetical protein
MTSNNHKGMMRGCFCVFKFGETGECANNHHDRSVEVGHEKGYFGHLALARLAARDARSSVGFSVVFRTLEKNFHVFRRPKRVSINSFPVAGSSLP